jgi:hypothetical protein
MTRDARTSPSPRGMPAPTPSARSPRGTTNRALVARPPLPLRAHARPVTHPLVVRITVGPGRGPHCARTPRSQPRRRCPRRRHGGVREGCGSRIDRRECVFVRCSTNGQPTPVPPREVLGHWGPGRGGTSSPEFPARARAEGRYPSRRTGRSATHSGVAGALERLRPSSIARCPTGCARPRWSSTWVVS